MCTKNTQRNRKVFANLCDRLSVLCVTKKAASTSIVQECDATKKHRITKADIIISYS